MAAALIGLILAAQTVQVQAPEGSPVDPLAVLAGDWQVVDTVTGQVVQDCSRAQSLEVTPDRRTLVLTERWADNWTARYRVVHSEPNRALFIIENETRRTDAGVIVACSPSPRRGPSSTATRPSTTVKTVPAVLR